MDLTTLFAAITLVFGLLTFDTIRTSDAVFVEVADVPAIEKTNIDQDTLEAEFARELNEVGEVVSIIVPPEIRTQRDIGVTRALGAMLKINDLAYAIETDLGYRSDRLAAARSARCCIRTTANPCSTSSAAVRRPGRFIWHPMAPRCI